MTARRSEMASQPSPPAPEPEILSPVPAPEEVGVSFRDFAASRNLSSADQAVMRSLGAAEKLSTRPAKVWAEMLSAMKASPTRRGV